MNNIKELIERVRENDEIATRFHKVERRILSVLDFKDFFEILLYEIIETFNMPYVWLSVIEGSEVEEVMLQTSDDSGVLAHRVNKIKGSVFNGLVGTGTTPILINKNLKPYYIFFPENNAYMVKSMAIAPITLDGKIIGSLNQGDNDVTRFEPGKDVGLLEQLAIKVSLCLSNVTAHEKLKFLAFHDPLTELLNRRVMESVLKREFSRSKRFERVLSLIFIDLDDFKIVNDTYGHDAGDEILKYVAEKLVELTRETDVVSRYAGDEFVVILPETELKKANTLLTRIQTFFKKNPMNYNGENITVSISFGAASTRDSAIDASDFLLKKADQRLYLVKQSNKTAFEKKETTKVESE